MATLKLALDTRRAKKNNTYPLVYRISINGESRDIQTGHSILKKDWNEKTGTLKKGIPTYQLLSGKMKELELKFLGKILEYEKNHPWHLNAQELRDYILSDNKATTSVLAFWQQEIINLQESKKHGCVRVYKGVLHALHKVKSLDVPFEKIDYNFLKALEGALLNKGVKVNSISVYMRALRRMYNQAVNAGVISYSHYPFRAYRIKKAPTVPHPISREEIIRYFRMDLSAQHKYYDSWLLGKLIFLLAGINVADLFQLTEENIKHGRVIYIRSKTKRVISIKLLPEAERIIQHFQRPGAKTLCGVLSEQELENRVKLPYVICQKGKNLNKHLTAIGKLINSASRIRSYTFRYTIANLCKQMGYDVQLISELLGHRYGSNTTSIYLQAYDHDLLDKMHVHVCKAVLAGG